MPIWVASDLNRLIFLSLGAADFMLCDVQYSHSIYPSPILHLQS